MSTPTTGGPVSRSGRGWLWLLVLLVVLAIAFVVVALVGGDDDGDGDRSTDIDGVPTTTIPLEDDTAEEEITPTTEG